jgi:hypothetical protein
MFWLLQIVYAVFPLIMVILGVVQAPLVFINFPMIIIASGIFIAAGAQDKVKVGDKFKIFPSVSASYSTNGEVLESQGVLTITQVTSGGSQGQINSEGRSFKIYPGDWVRSAFVQ